MPAGIATLLSTCPQAAGVTCALLARHGIDLIATAGVATAISLVFALNHFALPRTVTPLGRAGNRKITMAQNRVQDSTDACLMTHPSSHSQAYLRLVAEPTNLSIACQRRKAYSGIARWDGANSLDEITRIQGSVANEAGAHVHRPCRWRNPRRGSRG